MPYSHPPWGTSCCFKRLIHLSLGSSEAAGSAGITSCSPCDTVVLEDGIAVSKAVGCEDGLGRGNGVIKPCKSDWQIRLVVLMTSSTNSSSNDDDIPGNCSAWRIGLRNIPPMMTMGRTT